MGKRSSYERRERDFYPTPEAAAWPLIPHLGHGLTFIEPCAGDGALIGHLAAAGLDCMYALDVEPKAEGITQADALSHPINPWEADYIITNPPFGTQGKPKDASGPRFKGGMQFEILDIASDLAPYGVFILSQGDTPFEYSGKRGWSRRESDKVRAFREATHIDLQCVSVDTSLLPGFRSTTIRVEICDCDFENEVWPYRAPAQPDLFGALA